MFTLLLSVYTAFLKALMVKKAWGKHGAWGEHVCSPACVPLWISRTGPEPACDAGVTWLQELISTRHICRQLSTWSFLRSFKQPSEDLNACSLSESHNYDTHKNLTVAKNILFSYSLFPAEK